MTEINCVAVVNVSKDSKHLPAFWNRCAATRLLLCCRSCSSIFHLTRSLLHYLYFMCCCMNDDLMLTLLFEFSAHMQLSTNIFCMTESNVYICTIRIGSTSICNAFCTPLTMRYTAHCTRARIHYPGLKLVLRATLHSNVCTMR